ncbi:MAG: low specificity L-threonine aldolase [Phycisphaerales bacterium]
MRTFRSDNNAGLCPEALRALQDCNVAHAMGYSDDDWSRRAVASFRRVFSPDAHVFFVPTGTAANTLSIAALTKPWQRILCHDHAHLNDDESTAPELFTHCRVTPIHTDPLTQGSLLTVDLLHRAADSASRNDVHQPSPGVLTLSNPTEFGEVYTPEQLKDLCDAAHALGYRVHCDGARFANAVAHVAHARHISANDAARALSIDAGLDALSFGGTKNGLAHAEAVLFFPQPHTPTLAADAAHDFPFLRKRAGHLLSKHRFLSAQFAAVLESAAWVAHASHANAMAARLADALRALDLHPSFPTQANAVFVQLPQPLIDHLFAHGHEFYTFGPARWRLARLMCSFDTSPEDIAALTRSIRERPAPTP